jgi:hypothetical protein
MADDHSTQSFDWHLPQIADKAVHQKMIRSFHEIENTRNKNRLLYPPDTIGPVFQLTYINERRD